MASLPQEYNPVFRIHIKPGSKEDKDTVASFTYCKENSVLGMGWPVDSSKTRLTWNEYLPLAEAKWKKKMLPVKFFYNNVHIGDLVWTRDRRGQYYLALVCGDWMYDASAGARKVDIVNRMPCKLYRVNVDRVPGKVVASFRATRTIQAIRSAEVANYSRFLWNKLSRKKTFEVSPLRDDHILTLLDDREVEDVVLIYLQKKHGFLFVPSSRRKDTMGYEFLLIHRCTGEKAIVQVKTGDVALGKQEWYDWDEKVFLFQAKEKYLVSSSQNVECLSKKDVLEFLHENNALFPRNITMWLDIIRESRTK